MRHGLGLGDVRFIARALSRKGSGYLGNGRTMKLYKITVSDGIVNIAETVISSDNRGVKFGAVPPHVTEYARQYANDLGEYGHLFVGVGEYVPTFLARGEFVPGSYVHKWDLELDLPVPDSEEC